MSRLTVAGLIAVSVVFAIGLVWHGGRRPWSQRSLWFAFALGGFAFGIASNPFWIGLIGAPLGALAASFLLEGLGRLVIGLGDVLRKAKPTTFDAVSLGDKAGEPGTWLVAIGVMACILLAVAAALDSALIVWARAGVIVWMTVCAIFISERSDGGPQVTSPT